MTEPHAVRLAREEAESDWDSIGPSWLEVGHVREIVAYIDELVTERDALRAELEAAHEATARAVRDHAEYVAGRATLQDITMRDGRVDVRIASDVAVILAEALVAMLDSHHAQNYVEAALRSADGKQYTMLVRRYERPTPHELRLAAEAERDALRERVAELEAAIGTIRELAGCAPRNVSDVDAPTHTRETGEAIRALAAERDALRARVQRMSREPLPPDFLVATAEDRVHVEPGVVRPARTLRGEQADG